ncbi:uncharacterized protein K489DRAFT_421970 [Dissoconium aciculare CBS 342.82]|uniref:PDZ GRASP-type domain-containing protein n=1 Tax=Dissoconium aciculare CBS 342.82 TaxID=1314786 RepID=A0A6J3MC92_9PEZI|nr:uncharacterized protein K489DRAFT_421970 [Dissoconium aciculare CBS 342.82]KAF1825640.1 hypothetical protein K489DRAFT_421970 [Dissoconium aciculare CBS 342.82]
MASNIFGTLNRFISRLDSDPNVLKSQPGNLSQQQQQQQQQQQTNPGSGFQILRNTNPSLPLEPWFDFIIGINGHNIESPDAGLFLTELRNCAPGTTISLGVYGAKGRRIREAYVTVPERDVNIGLSLQWTPLALIDDCCWHILDVMPNSPADVAGLLPYSDYVVGSPDAIDLRGGDSALGELIAQFVDRALRLFVYNHEYDVLRTPSQAPGETLFDSTSAPAAGGQPPEYLSTVAAAVSDPADLLVPANLQFTSPASPASGGLASPPPPSGAGSKARKARPAAAVGLDDYFAEGEQKSRELDNAPKAAAGGVPPPPKAGAGPPPPRAAASAAAAKEAAE